MSEQKKLTIDHKNGHVSIYNLFDKEKPMPIAYHAATSIPVVNALEKARISGVKVRIYCGDVGTGIPWVEENYSSGRIGLSKGRDAYFPLLIVKDTDDGGGGLLDHCILKIKALHTGKVLYQAENFVQPVIDIMNNISMPPYTQWLFVNGELYSRHKTSKDAEKLRAYLL